MIKYSDTKLQIHHCSKLHLHTSFVSAWPDAWWPYTCTCHIMIPTIYNKACNMLHDTCCMLQPHTITYVYSYICSIHLLLIHIHWCTCMYNISYRMLSHDRCKTWYRGAFWVRCSAGGHQTKYCITKQCTAQIDRAIQIQSTRNSVSITRGASKALHSYSIVLYSTMHGQHLLVIMSTW